MQGVNDLVAPTSAISRRANGRGGSASVDQPLLRISAADVDLLMGALEVRRIELEECMLRNERRFECGPDGMTHLYYGICGSGSLTTTQGLSIAIAPHTLVVVPPVAAGQRRPRAAACDHRALLTGSARILHGRFHAALGGIVDLFDGLSVPIVERFAAEDDLPARLKVAVAELRECRPGSGTMTASLMTQVMVLLLRRSLTSPVPWVERFAILRDHRISRAFAEMAARPGAAHTVDSLARTACLSRSTFMARFHELVGRAPMSVLRDLRMRQAARQLRVTGISIGQIGQSAGYANNSGFIRAFRRAYGMDPRDYRAQALLPGADDPDPMFATDPSKES